MTSNRISSSTPVQSIIELVTMEIDGQIFGIKVSDVRDVLGPQKITRIPLAAAFITGSINLRGRIVTVLDLREILAVGKTTNPAAAMNVVIESGNEAYSILIDKVGDVLQVDQAKIETIPQTVDPAWKTISHGIIRLQDHLVLVLDLNKLLAEIDGSASAAGSSKA